MMWIILWFWILASCSGDIPKLVIVPEVETPPPPSIPAAIEDVGTIQVDPNSQVDILFVVDDSGSMETHQKNLSKNIELYVDQLGQQSNLDYRVGVVTTDMENRDRKGKLYGRIPVVNGQTPNAIEVLKKNLQVGIRGAISESHFDPVVAALSEPNLSSANQGFYRESATLNIVWISDAHDQSRISVSEMARFLRTLKNGEDSKIVLYAALVPSGQNNCPRDDSGKAPQSTEELIQLFGGRFMSLCDADYGKKLASLGSDLVKRLSQFIPLSQTPVLNTLKVKLGQETLSSDLRSGWAYDPKRVGVLLGEQLLEKLQGGTEKVNISYTPSSN